MAKKKAVRQSKDLPKFARVPTASDKNNKYSPTKGAGKPVLKRGEKEPVKRQPRKMSRLSRILSDSGLGLRKALGQNFLVNQGALEKIASSTEADANTMVIEIGCGLGNLTELIVRDAGKVLAVELDERFGSIHSRELGDIENLEFLYQDFMSLDLPKVIEEKRLSPDCKIHFIGNIPYHLTSPILFKLIESPIHIDSIVLLMQREVAQRLAAKPGRSGYGILATKVGLKFVGERVFTVSPGSFLPPPKVHSGLVRMKPRPGGSLLKKTEDIRAFFTFVDSGFAQRRKYLAKSLSITSDGVLLRAPIEEALEAQGLDIKVRAENLDTVQFLTLFEALGKPRLPQKRRAY